MSGSVRVVLFVEPGAQFVVEAPRSFVSGVTGQPGQVPWVVDVLQTAGVVSLQVENRELLTELRDAITSTLDANRYVQ